MCAYINSCHYTILLWAILESQLISFVFTANSLANSLNEEHVMKLNPILLGFVRFQH